MLIMEVIGPVKPAGVEYNDLYGNKSYSQFYTKLGHKVKVIFTAIDDITVDIMFSVDGDIRSKKRAKDPELLPGVLYLILEYVENHPEVEHIKFFAITDENDIKIKYNIPLDPIISNIKASVEKVLNKIQMNPEGVSDRLLNALNSLLSLTSNVTMDEFKVLVRTIRFNDFAMKTDMPEYAELVKLLLSMLDAYQSYSPEGVKTNRNRRFDLYSHMVNTYFADKWNIKTYGTHFHLTRKAD